MEAIAEVGGERHAEVDETSIRVGGQWRYLDRAVDGTGLVPGLNPGIDFLLSVTRDKPAARRFFRQALGRKNTRNPWVVVTDRLKGSVALRCRGRARRDAESLGLAA